MLRLVTACLALMFIHVIGGLLPQVIGQNRFHRRDW